MIVFPAKTREAEAAIKKFLKQRMYRHERVMRVMRDAEQLVFDLFARYQSDPAAIAAEWLPPETGPKARSNGRDGSAILSPE